MPKLNQIIAVVAGKKTRTQNLLTEAHRGWNKDAISGLSKTYQSKNEDGDQLPPESKLPHLNVKAKVAETMASLGDLWDVVATQEFGNTSAAAKIEGFTDLGPIPVTVLLFLQKQLVDLHTFVSQLPTLPADRQWHFDGNRACYVTSPADSLRTQKVVEPLVKYEATKEHPAQTELVQKDVPVGTWTTTHMSSAIRATDKADTIAAIEQLQDAVKSAREEANSIEVSPIAIGEAILSSLMSAV